MLRILKLRVKFLNFLKSRLIFDILFYMFANKNFTNLTCAYLKKNNMCYNVKSLENHFHVNTKISEHFQICISASLIAVLRGPVRVGRTKVSWETLVLIHLTVKSFFEEIVVLSVKILPLIFSTELLFTTSL